MTIQKPGTAPPFPYRELVAEYVAVVANRAGESHLRNIKRTLGILGRILGPNPVPPSRSLMANWRDMMERDMAPATVTQAMGIASSFFNWLLEREELEFNPFQGMRRPRAKQVRPYRAFSENELAQVLSAARALDRERDGIYKMEWVLRGLAETGMRFGAFAQVRWGDLRLGDDPAIHVRAETTKTKQSRVIPLRRGYADTLSKMLDDLTRACGDTYKTDSTVWRSITGKPFLKGSGAAWDYLERALDRAGIPKRDADGASLTIHSFRHTACTRLLRHGADHAEVMAIMGHKTPGITLGTYNKTTGEDARGAVDRLPPLEVEDES